MTSSRKFESTEWLDAKELSRRLDQMGLKIKPDTFRHWSYRHDDFPAGKQFGHVWVWPFAEILAWLQKTERLAPR